MMRRPLVMLALSGCGRVAFDTTSTPIDDAATPASDATDAATSCAPSITPDPLFFRGKAIEYTSFMNTSQPVSGAAVEIRARATNTILGQAVSDAQGVYNSVTTTDAEPRAVSVRYSRTGFYSTVLFLERLDRNYMGNDVPLWSIGDGPMWTPASMGSLYNDAAGIIQDPSAGTINVAVRDCAGAAIPGVTVTFTPTPGMNTQFYQASDGTFAMGASATTGPFAHVFVLNAAAVETTITATAPGYTFEPVSVVVQSPSVNTLAIVHGVPTM